VWPRWEALYNDCCGLIRGIVYGQDVGWTQGKERERRGKEGEKGREQDLGGGGHGRL